MECFSVPLEVHDKVDVDGTCGVQLPLKCKGGATTGFNDIDESAQFHVILDE